VGQAGLSPSARWIRWAAFAAVALFGLALRLPQLDARPMHTDEAVNAYIVGQLLAGQKYTYDPQDRHGPALAALALSLVRLQGAKTFAELTEAELRRTPVVAGTVTILLFGAAAEIFGFVPCLIAALLFACAPLTVYYDRYFIHESLFVAATFGLILCSCYACTRRSAKLAVLAAACAALMLASKETVVLHFAALAGAALLYWLWNLRRKSLRVLCRSWTLLTAVAVFLLLSVALFTWFGTNWSALAALAPAAANFAARAGGEGHAKPFWYYAHLLAGGRSGALICTVACIGLLLAVRKREASPFALLAYYAVLVFVLYSAIPYKTPWLALNFWLPLALLVGLAAASLWQVPVKHAAVRVVLRAACFVAAAVAAVLIAHDTRQRVFLHPADEDNPYAYAHTSEDLLGLPMELAEMVHQEGLASPRIAVIAADPWPLPWYLRQYAQVGYWQPGQMVGQADFYITSTDAANQYANQLKNFHADFFGDRPGVLILLWLPVPK
jgi:uncharacterized protein (TIGR03663 family)